MLNIFHSGGLFMIPIVLFLASLYCFYRTSIIRKGGMEYTDPITFKTTNVPGKPPFLKIGVFIFAVVLLAAAIVTFAVIASDYAGV